MPFKEQAIGLSILRKRKASEASPIDEQREARLKKARVRTAQALLSEKVDQGEARLETARLGKTVNNVIAGFFFLEAPGGTDETVPIDSGSNSIPNLSSCVVRNSCDIATMWENCLFRFEITMEHAFHWNSHVQIFQAWGKYCRNANLLFGINAQWRTKNRSRHLIDHCKICVEASNHLGKH